MLDVNTVASWLQRLVHIVIRKLNSTQQCQARMNVLIAVNNSNWVKGQNPILSAIPQNPKKWFNNPNEV
jgi:hypothetical protein